MILGIGTDIVLVARIGKLRPAAVSRLLTAKEKKYCDRFANVHERVAGRFAAKESILKAMGTGLSAGMTWREIEILPDALGSPRVSFFGSALKRFKKLGATRCHISISHEKTHAIAFAILEK